MAETVIKHRRGTTARLETVNPYLQPGEIIQDINTGAFKMGPGNWLDLPYFVPTNEEPPPSSLTEHVNAETPHPAYDDGPSLTLLYQNAKV